MKKILLITSTYTGHGHKSLSDALSEQLRAMPDVEIRVVDGFDLMGRMGVRLSKLYGPTTRYAKQVWRMGWMLSDKSDRLMNRSVSTLSNSRFYSLIDEFQPNLIVTVHSMFNGSVLRLLRARRLEIPLVVLQADIINIHKSWCNPQAFRTICPTQEAYDCSIRHGMPAEKLVQIDFPVRSRFTECARSTTPVDYDGSRTLRCLMMSGGEGSGNLIRYAQVLLDSTDVQLTIICGRNKKIRKHLNRRFLPQYADRIRILGFVTEIQNEMATHDVLIARGSPNSLLEGVMMNLPLIVTGALPGQERDNPRLIAKHNLGLVCRSADELPQLIQRLLADDCALYRSIRQSQRLYRNPDAAKNLAEYIHHLI